MAGRPRGTGGRAEELTQDQIHRIDKCLTGTRHELRNRAIFYLGLGSGMRISEIIGLEIGDVADRHRVRGRIVLEHPALRQRSARARHKSPKHSTKSTPKRRGAANNAKRSRTVAVSKQAVKHLQEYLDSLTARPRPAAPLFPSQTRPRRPMTSTNAIMILRRMFLAAGVENASSHSLRRTHANTLRRNGVDLKVIQEQLGHSSLAITERYFDVDPLEQQRAIDQLMF